MHIVRRAYAGFSLIEIAVVLFIGGMLLAGALQLTTSLVENAKQKATRENMQAIKVALQNYVGRTGRLPCPAIHTVNESGATFGVEAPTPGTCTGTVNLGSGLAKFGTLPWKTLGLSAASALDGWYNQFSYVVTTTSTSSNLTTVGVIRGSLTVHTDAPVANGLPATGNQINACSTTAGDNSCNLLATVIIISHGGNGLGAYTRVGAEAARPTSNREIQNAIINATSNSVKTNLAFVNSDYSEVTTTYFDDIVMALSPAEVLAPLLAQGGVKYESTLLVEKFRQLTVALTAYGAENRTISVVPPILWQYPLPPKATNIPYTFNASYFNASCDRTPSGIGLPNVADMQLIKDPWGNSILYERATDIARASESCPTYAVFVSPGADGNFATTNDNTVYYLSKGEYDAIIATTGW